EEEPGRLRAVSCHDQLIHLLGLKTVLLVEEVVRRKDIHRLREEALRIDPGSEQYRYRRSLGPLELAGAGVVRGGSRVGEPESSVRAHVWIRSQQHARRPVLEVLPRALLLRVDDG